MHQGHLTLKKKKKTKNKAEPIRPQKYNDTF